MSSTILYNYYRSSASYRVRIALNIKGIAFEYRAVHLLNGGGEQHNQEYVKLNPSHEVPTLIHNGNVVAQSVAIVDYLDRVAPEPRLFPEDPYQRSLVMQACEIVNSGSQPNFNLRVLGLLEKEFGASQEQKNKWAVHWLEYGLKALENHLSPRAGLYSFGDALTAADCYVVPQLAAAARFNVDVTKYPVLLKIGDNCNKLDSFKRAAPGIQPDSPPSGS